jgi:integrase
LHRASGRAIVSLNGKDHYLGEHGSAESRERYVEIIGRWLAGGRRLPEQPVEPVSVAEVLAKYLDYAERYYANPNRRRLSDLLDRIKQALRPVRELFAREPADRFRARALLTVRQRMIDLGHNRQTINGKIQIVKRCFRWAAREELVPESVWHSLSAVEGLRMHESSAPEPRHVEPVADDVLDAIKPHLSRQVRALVELQRACGCRPGEACAIRGEDIDRSGEVWLWTLCEHKTAHHGRRRVIALGPLAQAAITPFLRPGFLFSPAEEERERLEARHAARTTPLSCGNRPGTHRKRRRRRAPGERYAVTAYARAISRACLAVWPLPADLKRLRGESATEWRARLGDRWPDVLAWRRENTFAPNQIRHAAATAVRREFGLEGAQVALGHANAAVTQVYAERDSRLAVQIARQIG